MKFGQLLYDKDEEVFTIYMKATIQRMSKETIGRELTSRELMFLGHRMITEVKNLIIKIDSSGIEK